ncbi:hypothetical protein JKP88DRAFT_266814 [Tribonema minus]|uniref:Uncharacterized protein n=1 Tax=Tribonema minus TaxID=303371 RepID=A0A835ZHH2_9STRA|nr:hypothetical protein JKP88DRAFT_266814 [Tribonema minus]
MVRVAGVVAALACVGGVLSFAPSQPLLARQHAVASRTTGASVRMRSAPAVHKFSLPLADDTRITVHGFERSHCLALANEVNAILSAFKRLKANRADGKAPYKEQSVEFIIHAGNGATIEIECNPNLYPDPFKAMVFVKVLDESIEVASQAQLTKLADVIKTYLANTKEA